jgi:anti-sigma B factor antagonist
MNYTVSEEQGIVILSLTGKIMGGPEATEINDKINQLIDEKKLRIVIDLENVEWMNSSGLGILIQAVTVLRKNSGALRLIHLSDRIKNLLRITKLSSVFESCDSFEDAVASFK